MPLNRVSRPGIENRQGVHFPMMHNDISVRVVVTREVLQSIAGTATPQTSYMAKFEFYRREFEAIASDKFDRGERGALKITPSDFLQFTAERGGGR